MKGKPMTKVKTVYRCSKTGHFITAKESKRRPKSTEKQRLRLPRRSRKRA